MGKYLAGLWLTIVAPFIGMIVIGGPDGSVVDHLVLHIAMIILGAISLWILVRLRRTVAHAGRTPSRGIGITCVILLVVQVLFLIGNAGEAAALIRKGGFHLGEAIFHDPLHYAAAWITPQRLHAGHPGGPGPVGPGARGDPASAGGAGDPRGGLTGALPRQRTPRLACSCPMAIPTQRPRRDRPPDSPRCAPATRTNRIAPPRVLNCSPTWFRGGGERGLLPAAPPAGRQGGAQRRPHLCRGLLRHLVGVDELHLVRDLLRGRRLALPGRHHRPDGRRPGARRGHRAGLRAPRLPASGVGLCGDARGDGGPVGCARPSRIGRCAPPRSAMRWASRSPRHSGS